MHKIILFLTISLFCINANAQQKPCQKEDMRASVAELNLTAEKSKVAMREIHERVLENEIANLKNELAKQKEISNDEQKKNASLDKALSSSINQASDLQSSLSERNKEISILNNKIIVLSDEVVALTKERDKARTWKTSLARVFGIGIVRK